MAQQPIKCVHWWYSFSIGVDEYRWCLTYCAKQTYGPVPVFFFIYMLSFYSVSAGEAMVTAPENIQNTWELSVQVDQRAGEETMRFKIRVKGDLHVGGLMLKLVEKISECLLVRKMVLFKSRLLLHNLSNRTCFTASLSGFYSSHSKNRRKYC